MKLLLHLSASSQLLNWLNKKTVAFHTYLLAASVLFVHTALEDTIASASFASSSFSFFLLLHVHVYLHLLLLLLVSSRPPSPAGWCC